MHNRTMKTIEEYTRFAIGILQGDVKEGKLVVEKKLIDEDKREVTIDLVFYSKNCPKKMSVTFNYNELTNKINCKKTTLENYK